MFTLIFTLFLSSSFSSALSMDMNAGLWEVEANIIMDGKQINPMKEMEKALAQMPKQQREQMKAMMMKMAKEKGAPVGPNLNRVCVTQEMIKEGKVSLNEDKNCNHTLKQKNNKNYSISFYCKDGAKGQGSWTLLNRKKYKGKMDVQTQEGKKVKMAFTGKFLSSKCK